MRVQPTGFFGPFSNRFSFRVQNQRTQPVASSRPSSGAADLARRMIELRERLDELKGASGTRRTSALSTRSVSKPASAISADPLEVVTTATPTTLQTSGLIGSPTQPGGLVKSFSGSSTAKAVLGGAYDGSLGDQIELTFQVSKGGILGESDVEVEVLDEDRNVIDTIDIRKELATSTFTLSTGLEVQFSKGGLTEATSFVQDLSTTNGVLDPDQVFQGSGLPGGATYQGTFKLASTAVATVGGTYGGAFDDTLQFLVTRGGIVGLDDLEIEVFDGNNDSLGKLQFRKELAPGTALSLENGLEVSLSSGLLVKTDQFAVAVKADDQVVFNGGSGIQAGTLVIGGAAIAVDELDTLQTLADKITSSAAGVTASFDTASFEFLLTRKEDGPDPIVLGSDDTGFFDAVGLQSGQHVLGTEASSTGVTELSELSGLSSGSFSINGEEVLVDVNKDTLNDVLARINSLATNVQATYVGNRLELVSNQSIDLQNGTSAFFDAVLIDTGVYDAKRATIKGGPEGVVDVSQLKRSLNGLNRSLGKVFAANSGSGLPDLSGLFKQAIRGTFSGKDENATSLNTGLGFRFQFRDSADVLKIDSNLLDRTLSKSSHEIRDFLSGGPGNEQDSGLIDSLSSAVDQALGRLAFRLDPVRDSGLLLDIKA